VSFDLDAIGQAGAVHRYDATEAALRAYGDATDDVAGGPVFAIVPVWNAIAPASRSVASEEARKQVVHYEQDMLLHRPIEPGMSLVSHATPVALLPHPKGTSLVIKSETRTEDGELVNEQYVTEFFRGIDGAEPIGERPPSHRFEAQGDPVAEIQHAIAEDQTDRYAAASGDDFAIHLDDEFARRVGLPGRIVHGLATMAHATRAVREAAGSDDPHSLRRIAVRFSAPLFPGETLTTRVWRVDGKYVFDALGGDGRPVLKDGLVELARS
jgi:acyl dehydratase